jgi:hypothetical protein
LGTAFFRPSSSKQGKGKEETLLSEATAVANCFRELRKGEVRKISIPRYSVN